MEYESATSPALHVRRVAYRRGAQESGDRRRIYGHGSGPKRASQFSSIAGGIFRLQTRMLSPASSLVRPGLVEGAVLVTASRGSW